jgi:hypothetical protein
VLDPGLFRQANQVIPAAHAMDLLVVLKCQESKILTVREKAIEYFDEVSGLDDVKKCCTGHYNLTIEHLCY